MMSPKWVGWAATVVGLGAIASSLALSSTRVGEGLAVGFGAYIAFFGLLSLAARDRSPSHWGLFVMGAAMFLLPWLGSAFVPDDGTAWTMWVAGILALILGAAAWMAGSPPTASGIRDYSNGATDRGAISYAIGWVALMVGVLTVALVASAAHFSPVGTAVVAGLSALVAVIALWSLLAGDPTRDFLWLAVLGFTVFLAPGVGDFAGEAVAWTAWVSGFIITVLGAVGYLRGESLDFGRTAAVEAIARYHAGHARRAVISHAPDPSLTP